MSIYPVNFTKHLSLKVGKNKGKDCHDSDLAREWLDVPSRRQLPRGRLAMLGLQSNAWCLIILHFMNRNPPTG